MDSHSPLVLLDLFARVGMEGADWQPFRPGVEIHRLYGGDDRAAALLRFQPGAFIPAHEHLGHEHILVLEGSQSDQHGDYAKGTLVVNPPGSVHRVTSLTGCVVLIL